MTVHDIDPNKLYFVDYWIDNNGEKHYESKVLLGMDLTENQIKTAEDINN